MGGMFKKPKAPKVDNSAVKAAEDQRQRAREDAQMAEAKKASIEAANQQRKANVAASGRASTTLAGENNGGSLLGG